MFRPSTLARRAIGGVLATGLCVIGTACRDDNGGDSAAFCGQISVHLEELRAVPQTPDDVDGLIDLWTDVGADVPLAIEPDWQAHILLFETAWDPETVDDPEKMEEVYARLFATERSSVAVASWIDENCGIDWGPVETIVPQVTTTTLAPGETPPATTTTVPG